MAGTVVCCVSPRLAVITYWGMYTETSVVLRDGEDAAEDVVVVNGSPLRSERDGKLRHGEKAREFLNGSNRCVRGFLEARSWEEAYPFFREGHELGQRLGEKTGWPAGDEGEPIGVVREGRPWAKG